ncbi:MAG: polyisoprenoid-binding protein [Opitutaceae bacterium]|nr:polyisoprenoid-binding protein [Opitutaceae bacterium]
MKHLLALLAVLSIAASTQAAVEVYKIDATHSAINYSLRHILSKYTSSFTKLSGEITVDRDNLEKSSVTATIDVTAVSTGNTDRDNHIKSADFFDAAKFPAATFKSKSWKKTGENTFDITGDLTIKDVTKEVVLKTTLLGFGPGMRPGTLLSGWEATTTIKKSEFGLAGPVMLQKALGDDVALTINIEAGAKQG